MPHPTFGAALGKLIYQKRKALGLTQLQLAEDAFQTQAKVRRVIELEKGTVANPHPKTIDPIIAVLQITEEELEACAKGTDFQPDRELDRAYREARNLIEAISRQFEHSNPQASLAEVDDFLRQKAREWAELRARIQAIESTDSKLANFTTAASHALAEGNFEEVDALLAQAEDFQQQERTLTEVRKQAQIRITRGDTSLLKGDFDAAKIHYRQAAQFFEPFDQSEMVYILDEIAGHLYEVGRRSTNPPFLIAADLLEAALRTELVQNDPEERAKLYFRLGLIYRNASITATLSELAAEFIDKAIDCNRKSLAALPDTPDANRLASAKVGLSNCLLQKGRETRSPEIIGDAIGILIEIRQLLHGIPEALEVLGTTCNALGNAFMENYQLQNPELQDQSLLDTALEAYNAALEAASRSSDASVWGTAKANCGVVLATKARMQGIESEAARFLRVQAISAYLASIETFPEVSFPMPFAEAHKSLSDLFFDQSVATDDELKEFYLFRAIASSNSAGEIFSKERYPDDWAHIQTQLGRIFLYHATLRDDTLVTDLNQAKEHFQEALKIFQTSNDEVEIEFCHERLKYIDEQLEDREN
ncbi:helix-turn-helix domain-containing protein [Bradyrhizobium japonicum]|uniref:helix-turn-helix domain-containing protein n=1 Tax=Bradyrhizobium japonicum TaxID=375 RepID=UPI0003F5B87A|nr:helix-turn-helix transcriptional regulator [Bradyrhizobium japonicum]